MCLGCCLSQHVKPRLGPQLLPKEAKTNRIKKKEFISEADSNQSVESLLQMLCDYSRIEFPEEFTDQQRYHDYSEISSK